MRDDSCSARVNLSGKRGYDSGGSWLDSVGFFVTGSESLQAQSQITHVFFPMSKIAVGEIPECIVFARIFPSPLHVVQIQRDISYVIDGIAYMHFCFCNMLGD